MDKVKKKWLGSAVGGLLLIGTGLSLFGEALILKLEDAPTLQWFLYGTIALVVFNAGISIFGQAVVYRSQMLNESNK